MKAVGLLSGGLDSALAGKLIVDLGIEVHLVYIAMPWGCGESSRAAKLASWLKVPFKSIPLADDYLPILKQPVHGFGSAHNPCIDCHIYMVRKAAEYMREIGAEFVFTGEVLGQRPMSQRRQCLELVEKGSGLEGRLLRPLSAGLMEPTIPEKTGLIDRAKLLNISGRGRRQQMDLAEQWGVKEFAAPGGGCLLTEPVFGRRIEDVLKRGCSAIAETAILGAGRYFPLNDNAFVMLGRDQRENDFLVSHALAGDVIFRTYDFPSPTAVLRCKDPSASDLELAAGLVGFFSKKRPEGPISIPCWSKSSPDLVRQIPAARLEESFVKSIWW